MTDVEHPFEFVEQRRFIVELRRLPIKCMPRRRFEAAFAGGLVTIMTLRNPRPYELLIAGGWRPGADRWRTWSVRSAVERVKGFLEAVRVRTLGLGQRFEPVGDLLETFLARGLGHARVHVGVLVRLARNGGFQVLRRAEPIGRPVAGSPTTFLEVLEMPVSMARLTFCRRTKYRRNVVVTFDVGLGREIQVAAIRLRFAGKRVFEILFGRCCL